MEARRITGFFNLVSLHFQVKINLLACCILYCHKNSRNIENHSRNKTVKGSQLKIICRRALSVNDIKNNTKKASKLIKKHKRLTEKPSITNKIIIARVSHNH